LPLDKRKRCAAILGLRLWEFSEFAKLREGRAPRRGNHHRASVEFASKSTKR
jgi:hypothetical protein